MINHIYKNKHFQYKSNSNTNAQIIIKSSKAMKLLFMTLLCIVVENAWIQEGKWHLAQPTNNSFIADFLQTKEGDAVVEGDSYGFSSFTRVLEVTLKGEELVVTMQVTMKSEQYMNKPEYSMKSTGFSLTYSSDPGYTTTKFYQNVSLTLVHRTKIALNSTAGNIIIDLIDIEALFPNRLKQLLTTAALLFALGIVVFIKYFRMESEKRWNSILGCFSLSVLSLWVWRVLIQVYGQSLFLSESQESLLLKILTIAAILAFIAVLVIFNMPKIEWGQNCQKTNLVGCLDSRQIIIGKLIIVGLFLTVAVFEIPKQLPLLFILTLASICSAFALVESRPKPSERKLELTLPHAALHFGFYFFPIAVFPYFAESINYPRTEASLWWAYILLYVFEVAFFYLNLKGGLFAIARRLRYHLKKRRAYSEVEEEICALCFREINDNALASGQIASGEASKVIHHFCNRYFHEACIKERNVERCFFDNLAWSEQSVIKEQPLK